MSLPPEAQLLGEQLVELGYHRPREIGPAGAALAPPAPIRSFEELLAAATRLLDYYSVPDSERSRPLVKAAELLARPRCGCPDVVAVPGEGEANGLDRWDHKPVRINTAGYVLGHLGAAISSAIALESLRVISEACGIELVLEPLAGRANVVNFVSAIDGRGRVLAKAELPRGTTANTQLRQWTDDADRLPRQQALAVKIHEDLHNFGLRHSPDEDDIMFAFIRPDRRPVLGRGDVRELVARYGPPRQQPQPPIEPQPDRPGPPSALASLILTLPSGERGRIPWEPLP